MSHVFVPKQKTEAKEEEEKKNKSQTFWRHVVVLLHFPFLVYLSAVGRRLLVCPPRVELEYPRPDTGSFIEQAPLYAQLDNKAPVNRKSHQHNLRNTNETEEMQREWRTMQIVYIIGVIAGMCSKLTQQEGG